MKLFKKDKQIKSLNKIVIVKDGMQTINPTEEMVLADGWEEYVEPEPTTEQVLATAKKNKIREIEHYDSSSMVNEFYINDAPVWIDKATRAGLKLRFEAEVESGKTETSLWYNGIQFPLNLDNAIKMLYAIEIYASQCYDNTQAHIANVNGLELLDSLEAYDYTAGYPEKLRF